MENQTYRETVKCPNCGVPNILDIPKGQTIKSKTEDTNCDRCGCKLKEPKYKL